MGNRRNGGGALDPCPVLGLETAAGSVTPSPAGNVMRESPGLDNQYCGAPTCG
jgi:hypothetical protein